MDGNGLQKRQLGYAVVLGVAAIAILIVGFAFKPRGKKTEKREGVENAAVLAEIESLRAMAQRNTLRNTSNRFADIAAADSKFLMQTEGDNLTKVMWSSDGLLISANDRFPSVAHLRYGEESVTASPVVWSAAFPFALYRTNDVDTTRPTVMHGSELRAGMWVVVDAAGKEGNAFVAAMYSGPGTTTCQGEEFSKVLLNAPLDKEYVGAGVFNIDGSLIAIVARCDNEIAAIPVDDIEARLAKIENSPDSAYRQIGFDVQPVSSAPTPLARAGGGLLVTDTWLGWPAQRSGVMPGDVIVAMDGRQVNSIADGAAALRNLSTQLDIRRGKKTTVSITLGPAGTASGTVLQFESSGVVVTEADDRMLRAGIRTGDQILQIDGRDASEERIRELITRDSGPPSVSVVRRGPKLFLAVWP